MDPNCWTKSKSREAKEKEYKKWKMELSLLKRRYEHATKELKVEQLNKKQEENRAYLRGKIEEIKSELHVQNSETQKRRNVGYETNASDFKTRIVKLEIAVRQNMHLVFQTEKLLDKIISKVTRHRLTVLSLFGRSLTLEACEKRKLHLEAYLFNLTEKYDTIMWRSRIYQEEIRAMLVDRSMYHNRRFYITKYLLRLKDRRQEIAARIMTAFDNRDSTLNAARTHSTRDNKHQESHLDDMRNMICEMRCHKEENEFVNFKNSIRDQYETETGRQIRKLLRKEQLVDRILTAYRRAHNEIISLEGPISERRIFNRYVKRLAKYEEKIQYSISLKEMIDSLTADVNLLQSHIAQKCKENEELDLGNQERYPQLEARNRVGRKILERLKRKVQDEQQIVALVLKEFANLSKLLQIDDTAATRKLGNDKGMVEQNIPIYIDLFERKIESLQYCLSTPGSFLNEDTGIFDSDIFKKHKSYGGPFKPHLIFASLLIGEDDDGDRGDIKPIRYKDALKFVRNKMMEKQLEPSLSSTKSKVLDNGQRSINRVSHIHIKNRPSSQSLQFRKSSRMDGNQR